jgi:hypothetical protein
MPKRMLGGALGALAWMGLAVLPQGVRADTQDADVARIETARHSLEWNWVPPGQADRYGHAETLIHASLPTVRGHVLDFTHYKDMMTDDFKASRVIGRSPDQSTDVYIQIAVLHGVVKLWDVARFSPPKEVSPGLETVEGHMVPGKGNVDDMNVVWTLRALGDGWTVLKVDLLLKPGIPAPQWALDEELRDSARYAVDSIHDRAQGSREIASWP